jgi:uncharacterized protein (TIGR02145 family)
MLCFFSPILNAQKNGSFVDPRDGKRYNWVQLGTQIWMAENLAFLPKVVPPKVGVLDEEKYGENCYVYGYYGNSVQEAKQSTNYLQYGVLYNWETAKNVCPIGWHLPSDEDYNLLEKELGMSDRELKQIYYREGGSIGFSLKSKEHWLYNGGGNDKYGFSVLPGGFRHNGDLSKPKPEGGFSFMGERAFFWTSTSTSSTSAYRRQFSSHNLGIGRFSHEKDQGYSVRCIKVK